MAAAALSNVWIWGTSFIAFGLVIGMDTLVSQAYGAGDFFQHFSSNFLLT